MAREAILRQAGEGFPDVALGAIQTSMAAGQREERVVDECPAPPGWLVAFLAVGVPTIGKMVRVVGLRKIGLVANFALERRAPELPRRGARVAAFAGGDGMGAHQREPGTGVFAHESGRFPADLGMALPAIHAQRRRMGIKMAPGATPGHIGIDRAAVVVAPQAGRLRMGPFK